MTSYHGVEAIDWFGFRRLWSLTVGYAKATSRIDFINRTKTLNESLGLKRKELNIIEINTQKS